MVEAPSRAPPFHGERDDGSPFDSSALAGHPYVLFFYPKANSLGCSREARGFAEIAPQLGRVGVRLVGVSVDSARAQRSFVERCRLPFPLVADTDRAIARAYGVLGRWGVARRVTFLVGPDGTVLETVRSAFPGEHLRRTAERFLSSGSDDREASPATPGPAPGAAEGGTS